MCRWPIALAWELNRHSETVQVVYSGSNSFFMGEKKKKKEVGRFRFDWPDSDDVSWILWSAFSHGLWPAFVLCECAHVFETGDSFIF